MANDVPRLCHLNKWHDFDGYGFNLYGDKGQKGQNIGGIDEKSPAELAGLKAGDKIIEVNGSNVLADSHIVVVEKIKSNLNEVTLLVVSACGWKYYTSKNVQITGNLDFIQHFSSPTNNPNPPSYYSKSLQKSSSHYNPSQPNPLRRCNLHRWSGQTGFGFNLQTLENKTGKYVGQIDVNSSAILGGLKEGDRILKVNEVKIVNQGHKEVVDLIRSDPERVILLVVDQNTDEFYQNKGVILGMDEDDIPVVECSNPSSNPYGQTVDAGYEMQTVSNGDTESSNYLETRFDGDENEENNNNNNNNTMNSHENNTNNNNNNNTNNNNNNNNNNVSSFDNKTTSSSSSSPPPIEFSCTAKEARMKLGKKTRGSQSNLSGKDKFNILQRL